MTMPPTDERIALVTGATRGIGREVARGLVQRGVFVHLGCRDLDAGAKVAREIAVAGAGAAEPLLLDVTDEQSISEAADRVAARQGRLDILVNNAGVLHELGFPAPSTITLERLRATYEVNVFGPIAVTQAMLPLLFAAPAGRIVNVTSGQASMARQSSFDEGLTLLAYNSSKTALNSATLQFARELRDTRIKVNLADPMHCATDINEWRGERSAADGARIVIELALLEDDGPTGGFFNENGPVQW